MASIEFSEAVAYPLSCVGLEDLTLKPKQDEALIHANSGHDVFAWFPRLWQVSIYYYLLPFMLHFKLRLL